MSSSVFLVMCETSPQTRGADIPRIGFLSPNDPSIGVEDFRQGLTDFGYREGESIRVEYRHGDSGAAEVLGPLAAELVAIPEVRLFVGSGNGAITELRKRTTKPIVMGSSPDPVEFGLIESLALPGGNITGVATQNIVLVSKRVELLKELVPSMTAVALIAGPSPFGGGRQGAVSAAKGLGLRLEVIDVRVADEYEAAFRRAVDAGVQGCVIGIEALNLSYRARIIELSARHRLPAVLAALATNSTGILRRSGKFVDRILKGASPASLPVELWTSTEVLVNLSTARTLGIVIPPSVLSRATEVVP